MWTVGNTDPGAAVAVGTQYTVTQASVSSPCVVSKSATSSRRGRALREVTFSAADHEFLRNRRRLDEHVHLELGQNESSGDAAMKHPLFLPDADCLVYHCFHDDDDCPDPAPAHACLVWGDDGSCDQPLCKWIRERLPINAAVRSATRMLQPAQEGAISAHVDAVSAHDAGRPPKGVPHISALPPPPPRPNRHTPMSRTLHAGPRR